jgi:hypothetical protein
VAVAVYSTTIRVLWLSLFTAQQYVFCGCRCLQLHNTCFVAVAVYSTTIRVLRLSLFTASLCLMFCSAEDSIVHLPPAGAAECVMLRVAGL